MSSGERAGVISLLPFMIIFASGLVAEGYGNPSTSSFPSDLGGSKTRRQLLQTTAGQFCVANPSADLRTVQVGLNWACGLGGANCAPIQPGGVCYVANNLIATASWAFNDYYQKNKATGGTCSFNGTASLTSADPSHGTCVFSSSGASTPATGLTPPPPAGLTPVFGPPPPPGGLTPVFGPPPPPGGFVIPSPPGTTGINGTAGFPSLGPSGSTFDPSAGVTSTPSYLLAIVLVSLVSVILNLWVYM